jgi:predicted O-methyltransferase YrrM
VDFETVAARVKGIPFMSPEHGRRVYDHVRRARPAQVLELGTAHGVSAAYMAAALAANGEGRLTTVDHSGAAFDPTPDEVLERAGVADRVEVVRAYSSYNWFLKEQVEGRSDGAGNCEPLYDFCYLDGSKNFNLDGLAVVLVEKLLRPGGWLLMDDLEWTYVQNRWELPDGNGHPLGPLSESERTSPHLRAVFELIVKPHPGFDRLVIEDEWYGWARKGAAGERRLELRTSRPLAVLVAARLRRWARARAMKPSA